MDPISYFTGAALLSGVIETGKMALSGVIGNSVNTAVWRAIPEIHQWYQGEGLPVNHHLQRALRTAYLAATEQILEQARREVDEDMVPWRYQALQWVKNQSDLLKDENYRPPVPPDGWEPAHIVEPTAKDATAGVAALRESLSRMLIGEWTGRGTSYAARLRCPSSYSRLEAAGGQSRLVRFDQSLLRPGDQEQHTGAGDLSGRDAFQSPHRASSVPQRIRGVPFTSQRPPLLRPQRSGLLCGPRGRDRISQRPSERARRGCPTDRDAGPRKDEPRHYLRSP